MKICIPIEKNEGLDSKPFNHFGSAPKFLVYDLESEVLSEISNGDLGHEHGNCQPMKALSNQVVDCVISAGIGQGAISKLNSMGIKVYKAAGNTALENIKLFKENRLEEFSINHTCSHNCNH